VVEFEQHMSLAGDEELTLVVVKVNLLVRSPTLPARCIRR
jgi:hypothetical protein